MTDHETTNDALSEELVRAVDALREAAQATRRAHTHERACEIAESDASEKARRIQLALWALEGRDTRSQTLGADLNGAINELLRNGARRD